MKKAFTLIEVNLAILVMAMGVLGLISLYSLGYRESEQSREDVAAAALAEKNLNALVTMLSDTNMAWSAWNSIGKLPAGGKDDSCWAGYFDFDSDTGGSGMSGSGKATSIAQGVFDTVKKKCSGCKGSKAKFDNGHLECGLVVNQAGGRCAISFRAATRAGTMVYQPIYFTEVCFQGDPSK